MEGVGGRLLLAAAGVAAGVIGTAGGVTSLVASPALLAAGIPPFAANVTQSVALLGSGAVVGGRIGPSVARRVPAAVLRVLIGICGLLLAAYLLVGR